jgi:hypothetical protein
MYNNTYQYYVATLETRRLDNIAIATFGEHRPPGGDGMGLGLSDAGYVGAYVIPYIDD